MTSFFVLTLFALKLKDKKIPNAKVIRWMCHVYLCIHVIYRHIKDNGIHAEWKWIARVNLVTFSWIVRVYCVHLCLAMNEIKQERKTKHSFGEIKPWQRTDNLSDVPYTVNRKFFIKRFQKGVNFGFVEHFAHANAAIRNEWVTAIKKNHIKIHKLNKNRKKQQNCRQAHFQFHSFCLCPISPNSSIALYSSRVFTASENRWNHSVAIGTSCINVFDTCKSFFTSSKKRYIIHRSLFVFDEISFSRFCRYFVRLYLEYKNTQDILCSTPSKVHCLWVNILRGLR